MADSNTDRIEVLLSQSGRDMRYPDTPAIADEVLRRLATQRTRRFPPLARAVAAAVLGVALLMTIPAVRSAVIEWIRVGAVRLFQIEVEEVDDSRPQVFGWIESVATRMTHQQADRETPFPVLIPDAALGFGDPDDVYLHSNADGSRDVYLVWRDDGGQPELALYLLDSDMAFWKGVVSIVDVPVNDSAGKWVSGPHMLQVTPGHYQPWFFVEGNVLLWEADGLTYRLETFADIDAAREIAESLRQLDITEE